MKKPILLLVAGVLLASISNVAHAQRERPDRQERRETFRNQLQAMTPQQRVQFFENRFNEAMKSASPEQRDRMMAMRAQIEKRIKDAGIDINDPNAWQKMQQAGIFNGIGGQGAQNGGNGGAERAAADAMRQMMNAAGITDFDVQDAVIAYVAEQNKARVTLLQLAQKAASALQTPAVQPVGATDTNAKESVDTKVATTFADYETAVKAENDRQEKALKDLDAKINYSGTPRIKSFLTLVGILNNDVLAIGGPAAVFPTPRLNDARQADAGGNQWNGRG